MPGAASARSQLSGTGATNPSSATATSSAWAPGRPSTNPNTRSPTAYDSTPSPRPTTTPAYSDPNTWTRGRGQPQATRLIQGRPDRYAQSVRFTVVAYTRTKISPRPGTGSGTSSKLMTSGPPYR